MILADTSVWVHHLRETNRNLFQFLEDGLVLIHPFVIGELSCGTLKDRQRFLTDLRTLPAAAVARDEEVSHLIEQRKIWGRGIGWIDAHLLASAVLAKAILWTFDAHLEDAAAQLGVAPPRRSS